MKKLFDLLKSKGLSNKCIAAALSNADIESSSGQRLIENLNYSADGLIATFPSIYAHHHDLAESDTRHPMLIANRAYALRMGNSDYLSGDGWKYRGRGYIQITGKFLYEQYFLWTGIPGLDPDLLALDLDHAAKSAYWYLFVYHNNRFKNYAEAENMLECRKIVNPVGLGIDRFRISYELNLRECNAIK